MHSSVHSAAGAWPHKPRPATFPSIPPVSGFPVFRFSVFQSFSLSVFPATPHPTMHKRDKRGAHFNDLPADVHACIARPLCKKDK